MVDQGLDAVIANHRACSDPNDFAPSRMGAVFLALAPATPAHARGRRFRLGRCA